MTSEHNRYLTTTETAHFLGYAHRTMIQSRCSGLLGGIPAPKHTKRGRLVFYSLNDLYDWLSQFTIIDPATNLTEEK